MLIHLLASAAAAAPGGAEANPYGLGAALREGGLIAQGTFTILVGMSIFSFYILFTKLFEQQKIINQGKRVRASFWNNTNLREGAGKLEANSAYRQIVDDGLVAQDQHGKLTDPVDQHDWMLSSLARSQATINSKLGGGLAFLATVGATAPFIGLFGTVVGIYRALIRIGASGQASIDAVAGPVGEALIMTALGLVVAVPAVLAYNWLQRRNKHIAEDLGAFSNDLHGYMVSGGAVRPAVRSGTARPATTGTATGSTATRPATPGAASPTGAGAPVGGARGATTTAGQTGGVQTKPNS
ncbi:biopolymer transport protein ExbB [Sphingomonas jejuensis]|uniref:Biopolymer transport protein ExbB n=1 Tax=Sphingomonas jejuensis TaxID=904715 RepID=A0ABX0XNS3_9SPHN|nr:MotA/TolQ/ExbB proton channel family protein [Sphingomonas jejuensis]NJC34340.1 biopolymer transport protein ExbB [Sphingomonas jejuensis]